MPQGQVVEVPLGTLNQKVPETAGPIGRLTSLVNAYVTKRQGAGQAGGLDAVRVEKREGFTSMPETFLQSGAPVVFPPTSPKVFAALGDQLFISGRSGAYPFAFSDQLGAFISYTDPVLTNKLSRRDVYTSNSITIASDSAHVAGRTLTVWSEIKVGTMASGGCRGVLRDDDGVVLASYTWAGQVQAKVCSDSVGFWVVTKDGADVLTIFAYNDRGQQVASATALGSHDSFFFDLAFTGQGVFLAYHTTATAGFRGNFLALISGSIIQTAANYSSVTVSPSHPIHILTNPWDAQIYVATCRVSAGTRFIEAHRINLLAALDHTYAVASAADATDLIQLAGYVVSAGSSSIVRVGYSILNTSDYRKTTTTWTSVTFAGSTSTLATMRQVSMVSRAHLVNGLWAVWTYYQSSLNSAIPGPQSTYFLQQLQGAGQNVIGKMEFGTAFADWHNIVSSFATGNNQYWGHVSSPFVDASGKVRLSLQYRAEAVNTKEHVVVRFGDDITDGWYLRELTTAGIREYQVGAEHGTPVVLGSEMFLPGLRPMMFGAEVPQEHGTNLALETPALALNASTAANQLTTGQTYGYVAVAEWTAKNGKRYKSPASQPVFIPLTSSKTAVDLTGTAVDSTGKQDIVISLYRTVFQNGVMSTKYFKVTNDLVPKYNDRTSLTWTYTDLLADTAAAVAEELYVDDGSLDRFQAPPFHCGAEFQNRAWLAAYDGFIWFSAERTESDTTWFSPYFRVQMQTDDPITAMAALEHSLVIYCRRSVWQIPRSTLPGPNGLPAEKPRPLPINGAPGCTGIVLKTDDGIVYAGEGGKVWLTTPTLQTVLYSRDVEDDLEGLEVTGLALDVNRRVLVTTDSADSVMLCYDTQVGAWSRWEVPAGGPIRRATSYKGKFAFITDNGRVWVQAPGTYVDQQWTAGPSTLYAVVTEVDLTVRFGAPRALKRVWECNFQGEHLGPHHLAVDVTYVDDDSDVTDNFNFEPDPSEPYVYELPPSFELVSAMRFHFADSFPDGASQGFALELLSFFMALEKGLNRPPPKRQIAPT